MLHLNKRGFAISTVLYGILSIMILLLISILAFLKNTKNLNTNFSSDIEEKLNNCVTDEIIIENCYASGSTVCDHTAYYSCIGIMDETNNPVNDHPTIKEKLTPLVVTSGSGLYADSSETTRYIYRGSTVNNYIQYDSRTWRIISVESDGSTKLILTGYSNPLAWDNTAGTTDWKGSTLNNFLNNTFYNSIADKSKLVKRVWSVGIIYDTGTVPQADVISQANETIYLGSAGTEGTIGLISAIDYLKATINNCSSNALNNIACSSWLTGNSMWIINGYKDVLHMSEILAGIIDSTGAIKKQTVTTSVSFSPVVYLNNTVRIASGDGTIGNPYVLD